MFFIHAYEISNYITKEWFKLQVNNNFLYFERGYMAFRDWVSTFMLVQDDTLLLHKRYISISSCICVFIVHKLFRCLFSIKWRESFIWVSQRLIVVNLLDWVTYFSKYNKRTSANHSWNLSFQWSQQEKTISTTDIVSPNSVWRSDLCCQRTLKFFTKIHLVAEIRHDRCYLNNINEH